MDSITLLFFFSFCFWIGVWANKKGRRWWLWVAIAAVASPLVAGIALLIAGDLEKEA